MAPEKLVPKVNGNTVRGDKTFVHKIFLSFHMQLFQKKREFASVKHFLLQKANKTNQLFPFENNILSFLLPLFQEGQLSVTGESMCTKYWLTA